MGRDFFAKIRESSFYESFGMTAHVPMTQTIATNALEIPDRRGAAAFSYRIAAARIHFEERRIGP